jgi:phosphomannomutase
VRSSGTEPLIRFYAEADSVLRVDALLKAAMEV